MKFCGNVHGNNFFGKNPLILDGTDYKSCLSLPVFRKLLLWKSLEILLLGLTKNVYKL